VGIAGDHASLDRDVADSTKHTPPPHMCYHATFGRSSPNHVGSPKKIGGTPGPTLGIGVWLTSRNVILCYPHYHAKFDHCRSNHRSIITEIIRR